MLVKGLAMCFYLGFSGSMLQLRQNLIKVGSKSCLLTCSSNITLSLSSYTNSALKKELHFCNCYLCLLYFWLGVLKPYKWRMFFSKFAKNLGPPNRMSCLSIQFHNTVVGLTDCQKNQRKRQSCAARATKWYQKYSFRYDWSCIVCHFWRKPQTLKITVN